MKIKQHSAARRKWYEIMDGFLFTIKFLHPDANPYWKKRKAIPSVIPRNNKIIPLKPESKKLSRPMNRPAKLSKLNMPILFTLNMIFYIIINR